MFNNKTFFKVVFLCVLILSISSNIYAETETVETTTLENVEILKINNVQTETIQNLLESISKEIKNIEDKISLTKTLKEYENYPAVRLNIDTPYFGLSSIIDSRLIIRDGVSTIDIASGYSIKNVVNKKVIKLETFEVSSIVVITRDLEINENMTYEDAQVVIYKLNSYLDQVKSTNKFLDKQLVSMVTSYFSLNKSGKVNDITNKISEVENELNYSLTDLSYINSITKNDIAAKVDNYYKTSAEIKLIKANLKNPLISDEALTETESTVNVMLEEVKTYREAIKEEYSNVISNIEIEKSLIELINKMNNEKVYMESYIQNAEFVTEFETVESKYVLTSKNIYNSMLEDITKLENLLGKVVENNLSTEKEELSYLDITNEANVIYTDFLSKQMVFLTDNIKSNVSVIKQDKNLKISSFEEFKYVYITLSELLTNISDDYKSNSSISNLKTISNLKEILSKTIDISNNFKENK